MASHLLSKGITTLPTLEKDSQGNSDATHLKTWLLSLSDALQGKGVSYLYKLYNENIIRVDDKNKPYVLIPAAPGQPPRKVNQFDSTEFRRFIVSFCIPHRHRQGDDISVKPLEEWGELERKLAFDTLRMEASTVGLAIRTAVDGTQLRKAIDTSVHSHRDFPLSAPLYLALLDKSIRGINAQNRESLVANLRNLASGNSLDYEKPNPHSYEPNAIETSLLTIDDYIINLEKWMTTTEIEKIFLKQFIRRFVMTETNSFHTIPYAWLVHSRMVEYWDQIEKAEEQDLPSPINWDTVRSFLTSKVENTSKADEGKAGNGISAPSGTVLLAAEGATGNSFNSASQGVVPNFHGICGKCGNYGHKSRYCPWKPNHTVQPGFRHPGGRGQPFPHFPSPPMHFARGGRQFAQRGRGFGGGRGRGFANQMAVRAKLNQQSQRPLPDGAPPTPVHQVISAPTPSTATMVPAGSRSNKGTPGFPTTSQSAPQVAAPDQASAFMASQSGAFLASPGSIPSPTIQRMISWLSYTLARG